MTGTLKLEVESLLRVLPWTHARYGDLAFLREAIARNSEFIGRHAAHSFPQSLFQSVYNFTKHYAPHLAGAFLDQKQRAGSLGYYLEAALPDWPNPGSGEQKRIEPTGLGLRHLEVDVNNGILLSASGEEIHFSDIDTGQPRRAALSVQGLQTFALLTDGSVLAVASGEERTVFGTGTIELYSYPDGDRILSLRRHRGSICRLAYSPCGQWLAAGHGTGVVRVHDVSRRRQAVVLRGSQWGAVLHVAFNPIDGSLCATFWGAPSARENDFYNSDNALRCWVAPDWKLQWERQPEDGHNHYSRFAISHNGEQIAVVSSYLGTSDDVDLLTSSSGSILRTVSLDGSPECVCFSPTDDFLAIGCESNPWKAPSIAIVSANAEDQPMVLHGHTSTVTNVIWASGVAGPHSCSYDGTIREWSLTTQSRDNATPHTIDVTHVAFAPDGRRCLSISDDDKLVLWSVPDFQLTDT